MKGAEGHHSTGTQPVYLERSQTGDQQQNARQIKGLLGDVQAPAGHGVEHQQQRIHRRADDRQMVVGAQPLSLQNIFGHAEVTQAVIGAVEDLDRAAPPQAERPGGKAEADEAKAGAPSRPCGQGSESAHRVWPVWKDFFSSQFGLPC